MTDHVSHHEGDATVSDPDGVVPVTPGRLLTLGKQVTPGDLDSGEDRQPLRQQGVLQSDDVAR